MNTYQKTKALIAGLHTPRWFFLATFDDGSTVTFYADNLALAYDHAGTLAADFKQTLKTVKRLKHGKDVTPSELAAAGVRHPKA